MFEKGRLRGKRILVTGGGSGLGAAMGRRFVELGAELVICGRRLELQEATAARMRGDFGCKVAAIRCDVRDGADVEAMMDAIWREAPLDILVNMPPRPSLRRPSICRFAPGFEKSARPCRRTSRACRSGEFPDSDSAGYINGEMVVQDGGAHLRSSGAEDLLQWTDAQWEKQRTARPKGGTRMRAGRRVTNFRFLPEVADCLPKKAFPGYPSVT
jgi:hypothetical protein